MLEAFSKMPRSNYSTETLERPSGYNLRRRLTGHASSTRRFISSTQSRFSGGADKLGNLFQHSHSDRKEVGLRGRGGRPSSSFREIQSELHSDRDEALGSSKADEPSHSNMSEGGVPKIVIGDFNPKALSRQKGSRRSDLQAKTGAAKEPEHADSKNAKPYRRLLTAYSSASSDSAGDGGHKHSTDCEDSRISNEEEYLQDLGHDADLSRPHLDVFDFEPTRFTKGAQLPSRPMNNTKGYRRSPFSYTQTLHPGEADFEDSLVQVLDNYKTSSCTLRLETAVIAFIASQLVVKDGESMRNYVVLTGDSHGIWATTYQEYVWATWPDLAEQILDIFDILVLSLSGIQPVRKHHLTVTSSSEKPVSEVRLNLQLPNPNGTGHSNSFPAWADIYLSSRRPIVARVVNAIAWFCCTTQPTRHGLAFAGCSLYQRYPQNDEVIFDLAADYQASLHKFGSDWPSNCWMPLTPNFAIAGDHVSCPRRQEIKGMEVSFDLMCYLCGLEYEIIEDDHLVLYGRKSMVYPVRQIGDCIEWHFEKSDGQSHPASGYGQRLSITDLSVLCKNTRHFIGLWTEPLITLGTERCDPQRIRRSSLPRKDREASLEGRSIGASIALPKVLSLNGSQNYKITSTRKSPYVAVPFLRSLDRMKDVPVLLYSASERRAWMVSFVSVLWHLARAKADTGDSIPPCETSSDGGEAAARKIREYYKKPVKKALPQEELDEDEKAYTIEILLREIWATLESTERERNRKRGFFMDQIVAYDMADIAQSKRHLHMKACNFASSGWTPLLDEVSTVLFCEDLQDPIVAGGRVPSQTRCTAARWDYIPTGFDILTVSLPCLEYICREYNTEGNRDKLTQSHRWHVPSSFTTRQAGRIFSDCHCVRGQRCHKLQDVRKLSSIRGFNSPITPPSRTDLSNNKLGAVIFRHSDDMEAIVTNLEGRRPRQQQAARRGENDRLSAGRDNAEHDDSGYSSAGSSRRRSLTRRPRTPTSETSREVQRTEDITPQTELVLVPDRPNRIKVHEKNLDRRTLEHYQLPWERDDRNRKFFVIKQYIDHGFMRELFEHTRRVREEDKIEQKRLKKKGLRRSNTMKFFAMKWF